MITLYFLFDDLAGKAAPVFQSSSDAVALRQARVTLESIPPVIRKDLKLYKIGDFDTEKLSLVSAEGEFLSAVMVDDLTVIRNDLDKEAAE